jgi:hypothetical protein
MSVTPANLNSTYGTNLTQTEINDIQTYLSGLGDLNPDGSINVQTSGLFAPFSVVEQTPPTPHLYIEQPVGHGGGLGLEGTNLPDIAAFINEGNNTGLDAFSNNIHIYNEYGGYLTLTNTDTGNMTIFNDNSGVVTDNGVGNNTINNYGGTVSADGTNDTVNQYGGRLYGGSGMITAYIHAGNATEGSGNGQIFELMSDNNGGVITGGSGSNQILEDFGTGDQLIGGSGAYQTLNAENARGSYILGGTGAHQTLIGSTLGGYIIREGTGDFQTATVSGADGTIYGGSGINQLLEATGINSTMTDGSGANQQLTATGGNSTININNGLSDTVTTQGSGNVINVANLAGATETIHGTATDTLNFADSWQNATVTPDGSGSWKIAFADTGAVDEVTGIGQANFAGVLHTLPPPPLATTQDYTQAGLSTLLANAVTPTELTNILNHNPNGAVVETVTGGPFNPLPEVLDANGNHPTMLLLYNSDPDLSIGIDTSNFPALNTIIGHGETITDNSTELDLYGSGLTLNMNSGLVKDWSKTMGREIVSTRVLEMETRYLTMEMAAYSLEVQVLIK